MCCYSRTFYELPAICRSELNHRFTLPTKLLCSDASCLSSIQNYVRFSTNF
jgi:hypothetical protein